MSAADANAVLRLGGRLAINPTDLSLAFPHGGTELGAISGGFLEPNQITEEIRGPARNEVQARLYLGESGVFTCMLRAWDDDALSTVFPNTAVGGVTGRRVVDSEGGVFPGEELPTFVLIFKANALNAPSLLMRRAAPALEETAAINMRVTDEHSYLAVFVAMRPTDGDPAWSLGDVRDLTL